MEIWIDLVVLVVAWAEIMSLFNQIDCHIERQPIVAHTIQNESTRGEKRREEKSRAEKSREEQRRAEKSREEQRKEKIG